MYKTLELLLNSIADHTLPRTAAAAANRLHHTLKF